MTDAFSLTPEAIEKIKSLPERELRLLIWLKKWRNTRRAKQTPPEGKWNEWGILSGRGFGKTLTGAHWICEAALLDKDPKAHPSHVIAPTLNDIRYTCFEGPTGILSILPPEFIAPNGYNRSNLLITLDNGAVIRGFSAEEPERLRGPQCARAWGDELAAWSAGEETWNQLQFGLRLSDNPQVLWTTTPKPKDLIRKLVEPKASRVIYTGTTFENRANLPDSFFDQLRQYDGTQIGRQELMGELIDSEEGAIIARKWLKLWPANKPLPAFDWIVTSLDTAFTERTMDRKTQTADPTACGTFGIFWHEDIPAMMLLDCWSDHLGFPDLIKRVKKEMAVAYGDDEDRSLIKPLIGSNRMHGSGRKPDLLIIEDKGSGISLRQALEREGILAYAYNPGRADKTARLHMVSHIFARGQFWIPESENYPGRPKTWVEPLLAQLCSFSGPGSIKNDDFVDVCSQAGIVAVNKGLLVEVKRDKQKERDDDAREQMPRVYSNPYSA